MPTVPLQYEPLKSVLLYIEPNIRFQISLCMPSISTLEKRIPLKIENLSFSMPQNEKCLKVNEYNYQLGVYRDFGHMDVPSEIQLMNDRGGCQHDIDQYGFSINPGRNTILPGDVDLRKEDLPLTVGSYCEVMEQEYVKKLRMLRRLLAERINQEYNEEDGLPRTFGPPQIFFRSHFEDYPVESIEYHIEDTQYRLMPYLHRQNNTKPTFTCWIQFTVTSPNGRQSRRFLYNKKLFEAEKNLITALLGNRKLIISVKNLKIGNDNGVFRFPVATKMSIENLQVRYWNVPSFEAFGNIIDSSSLPLQQLKLGSSIHSADFTHRIVKESKKLVIDNQLHEHGSWTPILQNLTHQNVLLERENEHDPPNNYMDLVENWLETGRPLGTTFSLGIQEEETVKQCLETLKQRHDVITSSERQVQLRINNCSMLNVCYEDTNRPISRFWRHNPEWLLSLTVVRATSD
ncbi:hypothetical protein GCK72_004394 [Caenorhabditis remanei]|uniref:Uncharacterized protein n=1 Tax=Caenorhabditis remanei TaxID=31234 RepID=A0A6A5HC82_CAERE|nr:hypothetical protein GCK72_004394 [Caenorhabditis remanei]KAF1764446.1 hypothetical protein GCK72_004394 [Caenorhabditis remanei]